MPMNDKPPVIIAQVSDFHVTAPGTLVYGIDPSAGVARCVAQLNAMRPRPDLVVISGDLAETGSAHEYQQVKRLLAPLEVPYVVIPGNHDARAPMRDAFAEQPYAWSSGNLDSLIRVGFLDIVLLDSLVPGASHGFLDRRTLDGLEATLSAERDRPSLVFLHHPPFLTGIDHMDRMSLRNADELGAVIRRHERVHLVASGHVHRCASTLFAGVRSTICPSVNHAVVLDLEGSLPFSYSHEPPGFHAHCWVGGGGAGDLITHTILIGKFDGPHAF